MPGLSHSSNKEEKPGEKSNRRSLKSHRSSKQKKGFRHSIRLVNVWIKNNPLKTIAFFSIGIIIYLTVLFYLYNVDNLNNSEDILISKIEIKGLLIPQEVLNRNKQVVLRFGDTENSFSLEKLKEGIAISPVSLTNCEKVKKRKDPLKFFIFLEDDRLYVNTTFIELASGEIIGTVNKKHLRVSSGNLSSFHSEDNFFEVLDAEENVVFNMQFTKPGLLVIQGYFISSNCIYVTGENKIYADHKAENYIEKASREINQIKKLYNYDLAP